MNGVLSVDKPAGITSHDVVSVVRRAARTRRVGHAGTLDPFATGLLVVAIGQCTRLLPYIDGEPKVYVATIAFGEETNTDDATGIVVRHDALPDLSSLDRAVAQLTGPLQQVPPAFSAKQVDGQRAYAVARRGGALDLPPVSVTVHAIEVLSTRPDAIDVRITCSGGTYIRALARDLGRAMHSAAHCSILRRESSGASHVRHAVSLDRLSPGSVADGLVPLQSPLELLAPMAHVQLSDDELVALSFGRAIAAEGVESRNAMSGPSRAALLRGTEVLAIAERTVNDRWQPRVVLQRDERTPSSVSDRA